jgi:kynurenine formamidase
MNWLWQLLADLKASSEFLDLTHAFHPETPHAPAFAPSEATVVCDFDTHGFKAHQYKLIGQWGTHADAPSHFARHGRSLDEIPAEQMLLPLVVLDVVAQVDADHDYAVSMQDVAAWEAAHGQIPSGAFVALRTGWSRRWPDLAAMSNQDAEGRYRTPGWSLTFSPSFVRNVGSWPADTRPWIPIRVFPGAENNYPCERYLLEHDRFQIELLTGLDRLPEAGAIVVSTFPKPLGGSGFPARVFAIVPTKPARSEHPLMPR